jgi:hypothetical protein
MARTAIHTRIGYFISVSYGHCVRLEDISVNFLIARMTPIRVIRGLNCELTLHGSVDIVGKALCPEPGKPFLCC